MTLRYAVICEPTRTGFSAYIPDLPGCAATGRTLAEVEQQVREAIEFHIEGLQLVGEEVPPATSLALMVEVETAQLQLAVAVAA